MSTVTIVPSLVEIVGGTAAFEGSRGKGSPYPKFSHLVGCSYSHCRIR